MVPSQEKLSYEEKLLLALIPERRGEVISEEDIIVAADMSKIEVQKVLRELERKKLIRATNTPQNVR